MCTLYTTGGLGHTHLLIFHVQTKKIPPSCLEKCRIAAWLSYREAYFPIAACCSGENLSVTPSPLALLVTLFTASLASFITVGLTDADSDPLGLRRSLRLEAFAKYLYRDIVSTLNSKQLPVCHSNFRHSCFWIRSEHSKYTKIQNFFAIRYHYCSIYYKWPWYQKYKEGNACITQSTYLKDK